MVLISQWSVKKNHSNRAVDTYRYARSGITRGAEDVSNDLERAAAPVRRVFLEGKVSSYERIELLQNPGKWGVDNPPAVRNDEKGGLSATILSDRDGPFRIEN